MLGFSGLLVPGFSVLGFSGLLVPGVSVLLFPIFLFFISSKAFSASALFSSASFLALTDSANSFLVFSNSAFTFANSSLLAVFEASNSFTLSSAFS